MNLVKTETKRKMKRLENWIFIVKSFVEVGDRNPWFMLKSFLLDQLWMFLGVLGHGPFFSRENMVGRSSQKGCERQKPACHSQDAGSFGWNDCISHWHPGEETLTTVTTCFWTPQEAHTNTANKTKRTSLVSLWVLSWWQVPRLSFNENSVSFYSGSNVQCIICQTNQLEGEDVFWII